MGVLKSAFNAITRIHSRPMLQKRIGSSLVATLYSPLRATPSNYFRYLSGPSQTVVTGSEFIVPISTMLGTQCQLISFDQVPTDGTWAITYDSNSTTDLNFDATASEIQTALRLVTGLGFVTVSGDYTDGFTVFMFNLQTPLLLVIDDGLVDATPSVALTDGSPMSPLVLRGDKLIDGSKIYTVKEIISIPDLGGDDMGFRLRVE